MLYLNHTSQDLEMLEQHPLVEGVFALLQPYGPVHQSRSLVVCNGLMHNWFLLPSQINCLEKHFKRFVFGESKQTLVNSNRQFTMLIATALAVLHDSSYSQSSLLLH